MPGRDELLQQNIARAQSKAASPQPQETVGKAPTSGGGGGGGGPRSFLGGNYDVYSTLESIQFQGALGDASMRGNIAYIRVWKRGGTAAQTNSGAVTQDPGAGSLGILEEELEAAIGERDTISNRFDSATGAFSYDPYGNVDNPIEVAESRILILEGQINEQRQKALGTQTPTTSGAQSPSTQIVASIPQNGAPVPGTQAGVGQVRSANPNGFTNALLNFGRNFTRSGPAQISYSGQANGPRVDAGAVPASGDMMWQFLFNPSELQLEAGPEFKGAEVWGVSDKANSGQPLHWSHNKNASLKFNSVLLNGFVFGRKVEALEQGLLELFMSREGEGQHGPHILEFVWGKRSFGPCVIKNIDIKEKMWDEGEVVNAELSFTLEQVPEWTINDGAYVDVARPGRRPLANDPTQQSSGAAPAPASAPSPAPTAGGGTAPDQKPKAVPPDPNANLNLRKKCTNLRNTVGNLDAIKSGPNFLGISQQSPAQAQERLRKYTTLYNYAVLNQIAPINVGRATPSNIEKVINYQWDLNGRGQTTPGRIASRYPTTSANNVISEGVSFLTGNLQTQIRSTTCSEALR